MSWNTLDPNHDLFVNLTKNPPLWWKNLLNDPQIYVDIRKDNSLNIYFMGASVMELCFKGKYRGKIHYKYVPIQPRKRDYLEVQIEPDSIGIDIRDLEIRADFDNFNQSILTAIKKQIKLHYSTEGEKALQARLVAKDPYIIDSEFAYVRDKEEPIRIDLVRLDPIGPRIVFFELKQVNDVRLDVDDHKTGRAHVTGQLKRYKEFIRIHKEALGRYYATLFRIKKQLGLIRSDELCALPSTVQFDVLEKPVLLVGGCTREWMKIQSHMDNLNQSVQEHAAGCFYFNDAPNELNLIVDPRQQSYRKLFN